MWSFWSNTEDNYHPTQKTFIVQDVAVYGFWKLNIMNCFLRGVDDSKPVGEGGAGGGGGW